jgi:ESCRT-II complex subunit VPS22
MCANVGVDPLASNKGAWAQLLGLGDFYYELGVAALEAAWASRSVDGGLVPLRALTRAVVRRRGGAADPVTEDDVARALAKLRALGPGVDVVEIGGVTYVRSVPGDLDPDRSAVLGVAGGDGAAGGGGGGAAAGRQQDHRRACGGGTSGAALTVSELVYATGWAPARAEAALEGLLREGLAMADDQEEQEGDGGGGRAKGGGGGGNDGAPPPSRVYWFPCLWDGAGGGGGAGGCSSSVILPGVTAGGG